MLELDQSAEVVKSANTQVSKTCGPQQPLRVRFPPSALTKPYDWTATHTHRKIDSFVKDLVAHVQFKIDRLPELAQRFNLSPETINELRQNLEAEKLVLEQLPPDAKLGEVLDQHLAKGKEFREKVTGKKEN